MVVSQEMMQGYFPFLQDKTCVYLDSAASAQKFGKVLDVEQYWYMHYANIHRGMYPLSQHISEAYAQARQQVAHFIGAQGNEVIFTSGTTQAINMLAYSIPSLLQKQKYVQNMQHIQDNKDHTQMRTDIVISVFEHHAQMVVWQQFAKRHNMNLIVVHDKQGCFDYDAFVQAITPRTALVVLTHMSNVTGEIMPVQAVCTHAHAQGAYVLVDAAQIVAHQHINVAELDCDFLCFSGHKLGASTGIGVLYGKQALLETMDPAFFGGDMVSHVTEQDAVFNMIPTKFEAGTPPIVQAIGLATAIECIQDIGMGTITEHIHALHTYAREQCKLLEDTHVFSAPHPTSIISLGWDDIHAHDVAVILAQHNICVRAGHHCAMPFIARLHSKGVLRISMYMYTTTQDIDRCIQVLKEAIQTLRKYVKVK
ncbi:MAG: aminotransferase class V-fold PLP-dependent enzyme [Candidatus Woesearchaeota archaeon]